jgi:hypothetical protein
MAIVAGNKRSFCDVVLKKRKALASIKTIHFTGIAYNQPYEGIDQDDILG